MSFSKSLRNKVGSNGDKTEEDSVKPPPKLDTENRLTDISNDTHDQLRSAFQSFGKHNYLKNDLDKSPTKRLPPLVAGKTMLAEDCRPEIINANSTSESIMDGYELPMTNRSEIPMTSRSGIPMTSRSGLVYLLLLQFKLYSSIYSSIYLLLLSLLSRFLDSIHKNAHIAGVN